ncbi:MAG: hypothetical protein RRB13_05555 [bacterium]|nr:hypothetical protein [bacterium]
MEQLIASLIAFGLAMTGLSLGVIFMGKGLKGSCGGAAKECGVDEERIPSCDFCESPEEEKARCARRKQRRVKQTAQAL